MTQTAWTNVVLLVLTSGATVLRHTVLARDDRAPRVGARTGADDARPRLRLVTETATEGPRADPPVAA